MMEFTGSRFLEKLTIGFSIGLIVASCNRNLQSVSQNNEDNNSRPSLTLTVAIESDSPPFASVLENGEHKGFDVELMNALAVKENFDITYKNLKFNQILEELKNGKIDVGISAISITEERFKYLSFSKPYFKSGLAIAVAQDNVEIETLEDLNGKKVGVQTGTTGANLAAQIPEAEIIPFDTAILSLQALSQGNIDAVINDLPTSLEVIAGNNIPGIKVVGKLLTEEFYGIALPKDSENLEIINSALSTTFEDGTYEEIYKFWFGINPPRLPESIF